MDAALRARSGPLMGPQPSGLRKETTGVMFQMGTIRWSSCQILRETRVVRYKGY